MVAGLERWWSPPGAAVRPVIDPFVFPKSLHQGQRYNALCSVTKGDPPIRVKWLKDSLPITVAANSGGDFTGINIIDVTPFSSSLIFDALRPEHSGNYTCEATNAAGRATYNATMIVHGELRNKKISHGTDALCNKLAPNERRNSPLTKRISTSLANVT